MKLDLHNSRFPIPPNNRVIDSLEDQPIHDISQNLSRASLVRMSTSSMKIRANKSKFGLSKHRPDRFDTSKVDRKGHLVEVVERMKNSRSGNIYENPSHAALAEKSTQSIIETFFPPTSLESNKKDSLSPILDKIKDRIHDNDDYTIASRLGNKKVSGGIISKAKRALTPPGQIGQTTANHVGPCTYETATAFTKSLPNLMFSSEKQSYYTDKEYQSTPQQIPLKDKLRLERKDKLFQEIHYEEHSLRKQYAEYIPPVDMDRIHHSHQPRVTLDPNNNNTDRFQSIHYKQEVYVKTTGLLLSQDYDKKFNKKIPFVFETSEKDCNTSTTAGNKAIGMASQNVDVDVGKHFALTTEIARSPIKYSAAFKSTIPVGMQLPPSTTAPHVGPGTFTKAYTPAVVVKNPDQLSLAFLTSRLDYTRAPLPDATEKLKSFAEVNKKGPIFSTERTSSDNASARNRHLTNIVKEKLQRIYPKLASKKFPSNSEEDGEDGDNGNNNNDNEEYGNTRKKNFVYKRRSLIL